ncbi:synapsin-1 (Synapsin I) [Flavonifractor sp. AGMB03687]|uniref:synapsin-1 (Synapsin I) n=1 Tax=Flavonifractor sp. AGMB03687 TaxID=2785133 RepID=UPI001AE02B09|nr:synapsin-1 (Synapsin I) [Flavonifractor sp. AGMB03687]
MTKKSHGNPTLPPKAKAEIMEVLFANMEISGDEIATILKKHHVSCDVDVLQDRYRRQLGQRLMASLRDDSGEREVLSNGKGRYVVLECCRDRQQLAAIRRRIQNQAHCLNASASKVRSRIVVLDRLIVRIRKAA